MILKAEEYKEIPDEELIGMIRDGDRQAMDFLMDKYKDMVKSRARSMFILGGDSQDLIQEGMIGLFKAIRDYDSGRDASFRTFAALCISRQLFTVVQSSGRKKNIPLNTALSLNAPESICWIRRGCCICRNGSTVSSVPSKSRSWTCI